MLSFRKKIVELAQLLEVSAINRKNKLKVIHCHGTFDLIHPGHLRHFQEAKSLGDILIVTITPDRFVIKGKDRPVFGEELRAESIASLEYVDFVSINDEPTAIKLLKDLKPSIYVKGSDYKNADDDPTGNIAAEVAVVEDSGGSVHFTEGIRFSSTDLINKYFSS